MIFGGLATYAPRCHQKIERREVYAVEPAMPSFLD
jgi:hypothetical protein